MSRIDDLLDELAPKGVAYRPLGEVVTCKRGKQLKEVDRTSGDFPVVTAGKDENGTNGESNFPGPSVTISSHGAYAGRVSYWSGPIWLANNVFLALPDPESLLPRFLYFVLKNLESTLQGSAQGGGIPYINWRDLADIRLPVPPLKVQREVVRVLDQFTKLEAELETELEARQKQYNHYRGSLLSPGDDWSWTTLGGVCAVFDGPHATPKKVDSGPWYLSISSLIDGRVNLEKSAHLAEHDLDKWTKRVAPQRGDTLFSYETRIGQAGHWDRDESAALGRRMGLLRPRSGAVDPKFLTLAYLGPQFQREIELRTVSGSTVDRIPIANMDSWPIALPSLERQAEIVRLLEQFDELANGFSFGLPAELRARRKQYEHYRYRLLTFEEVAV